LLNKTAIGAGLLLLGLAASGSAAAQVYSLPPGLRNPALPPYEIMQVVSSHGLTPSTRPVRRGPNYVLLATDRAGQEMRVVVDARLGDIVNLSPAGAGGREAGLGPPLPRAGAPSDLQPVPGRSPPPAAGLTPPPPPAPNPRVVANPPNPAPVSQPPPPPAAAPGRPAAAAEPPALPPLPPPPPLPRPRPNLAEAPPPPEVPPAPPVVRSPFPAIAAPAVNKEPQIE
jgi:hypothetical protein